MKTHRPPRKEQVPLLSKAKWNCRQKDAYPSKRIADIRAEQIGPKRGVVLFSYKCKECKEYHLTRKMQRNGRAVSGTVPTIDGFKAIPDA